MDGDSDGEPDGERTESGVSLITDEFRTLAKLMMSSKILVSSESLQGSDYK